MKKTVLFLIALALFLPLLSPLAGCGGGEKEGMEEEVVDYVIGNILIAEQRDSDLLIEWMRLSTGVSDVSPDELGLRFWKWQGGTLTEITLEEFKELAAQRINDDPRAWTYSQHSITVLEMDEETGEAVVEVGSLRGPLSGSGVRYLLHKEEGEWKKVSEATVWGS